MLARPPGRHEEGAGRHARVDRGAQARRELPAMRTVRRRGSPVAPRPLRRGAAMTCAHCGDELEHGEPELCSFCFTAHVRGLPATARLIARERRAEKVALAEAVS